MTHPEHRPRIKYNYMTEQGRQGLYESLELYKQQRAEAQLALGAAAGRESDWHDNAAYDLATEQFNLANARMMNAQKQLERVYIITPRTDVDDIQLGNTVRIQFAGEEEIEEYTLLGPADSLIRQDWLSYESPLGKAMIGRKAGEHVTFDVDKGKHNLEIIIQGILPGNF